jgi:hypothetical protein
LTLDPRKRWLVALGLVAGIGAAIRVSNAFRYPVDMGFDAIGNWQYIALLLRTWTLPPPDAGWSTAHPPFFYGLAAAIVAVLGLATKAAAVHAVRLVTAGFGLLGIAAATRLVQRMTPEDSRRALLCAGLLLFLPVHLYMSAMLSEEILVSALVSVATVGVALDLRTGFDAERRTGRVAVFGAVAGLALLTKLSGLLVVGAGVLAYGLGGWRGGAVRRGLHEAIVFGVAASIFGGWYYLWNLFAHGYLYPHGLGVHSVMFQMPPGERGMLDYLRIPIATFSDPQLLAPDLLHSVWGSTYVTVWFDGHRQFLPYASPVVARLGTAMLLLALVPTAAFGVGVVRGARRLVQGGAGPDLVLVPLVVATFAGYVAFTWQNPWFAALKGSFLLGLAVPFACYASEVLTDWTGRGGAGSRVLWVCLGLLAALSIALFTYGLVFAKLEVPGVPWRALEGPWPR